jgi:tol-pal system protein YbgF
MSMILVLVISIGYGCAARTVKPPAAQQQPQRDAELKTLSEQVASNTQLYNEAKNDIANIKNRLAELENKVDVIMTEGNAAIQELNENVSFLKNQILRLDNSVQSGRPVTKPSTKSTSAFKPGGFTVDDSYKGALDAYYTKNYETAINGFTEILSMAPTSPLADNAQYWLGECYYSLGNYPKALESFNKVFDYPKSNKLSDAHIKIAKTFLKMGNVNSAKEELKTIINNYPGTDAAKIASQELEKL